MRLSYKLGYQSIDMSRKNAKVKIDKGNNNSKKKN